MPPTTTAHHPLTFSSSISKPWKHITRVCESHKDRTTVDCAQLLQSQKLSVGEGTSNALSCPHAHEAAHRMPAWHLPPMWSMACIPPQLPRSRGGFAPAARANKLRASRLWREYRVPQHLSTAVTDTDCTASQRAYRPLTPRSRCARRRHGAHFLPRVQDAKRSFPGRRPPVHFPSALSRAPTPGTAV